MQTLRLNLDRSAGTIDLGRQTVTVVQGQLVWQHEGKTDAATRTVAIDPQTLEVLDAHRQQQRTERDAAGPAWVDHPRGPLVFTDPLGGPIRPDSFYRVFARIAREIGAPPLDVHGLRHSYATAALRAGVSPEVLSQRLGHSDVGITLSLYAHVRPSDNRDAASLVANAIDEQPADASEALRPPIGAVPSPFDSFVSG